MTKKIQKITFYCNKCGDKTSADKGTKRQEANLCRECYGKKKDVRKNQLNDLSGKEWASLSKSVEQYLGSRSEKQRLHGAAFPISFVESHIKIFTKRGDTVLDPFLGVGTTSQVAEAMGRKSIGLEINKKFVELAKNDIQDSKKHKIICDDVRNILKHIKTETVDFIITSPPYADMLTSINGDFAYKWREHSTLNIIPNPKPYSRNKKDFGSLSYSDFLKEITKVFINTYKVLKKSSYSVWVVKDYRNLKKNIPYVNFHSDIINCAIEGGFLLWDIRIYDQTKFRPLVVLGYPSRNYYLNIGHSYILIFKKP